MTHKRIRVFLDEVYSKPAKKKLPTNKTDVFPHDDTWGLDILDLRDYGAETISGYR